MIFIVENFHNNLNKIKEGAPAAPPLLIDNFKITDDSACKLHAPFSIIW